MRPIMLSKLYSVNPRLVKGLRKGSLVDFTEFMQMTTSQATAEIFETAFRALPKKARSAVIERLLLDDEFMEDLFDIVTIEQRRRQPSRSLEEYLASKKKQQG